MKNKARGVYVESSFIVEHGVERRSDEGRDVLIRCTQVGTLGLFEAHVSGIQAHIIHTASQK